MINGTIYISIHKNHMIRHIGMFRIKAGISEMVKKENISKLKNMIDDLKDTIPEIHFPEPDQAISCSG
jgi:hypothetical protein